MAERPAFLRFAGNQRGRWKISPPGAIQSRSVCCSLRRQLFFSARLRSAGHRSPGGGEAAGVQACAARLAGVAFSRRRAGVFPRLGRQFYGTGQSSGQSAVAVPDLRRGLCGAHGPWGRWKGICGHRGRERIVRLCDCLSGCSILICISARHRASLIFCFVGLRPVSRRSCFSFVKTPDRKTVTTTEELHG
jgi:hypothetical protein